MRTTSVEIFSADFVVGADGVHSVVVRRHVVGPIPRQHVGLAVGYLVNGAPNQFVFPPFGDLHGYLWSFPRTYHMDVGICSRLGQVRPRELWQRVDNFLAQGLPGSSKQRRWAALLPMAQNGTLWDTACAGPGWALVGDAAGHVHPLTGEGISYALWSGELLARALKRGTPQVYDSLWREEYGAVFAAATAMLSDMGGAKGGIRDCVSAGHGDGPSRPLTGEAEFGMGGDRLLRDARKV